MLCETSAQEGDTGPCLQQAQPWPQALHRLRDRQGNKETVLSPKQRARLLQDSDIVTLGDSQLLEKLCFPSSAADGGFLAGGKG